MKIFSAKNENELAEAPETEMGIQIYFEDGKLCIILNSSIVFVMERTQDGSTIYPQGPAVFDGADNARPVPNFGASRSIDEIRSEFIGWRNTLDQVSINPDRILTRSKFYDALHHPILRHLSVKLPYQTVTSGRDVFYRWEAFPISKRIDIPSKTIAADTYAAPFDETPFAPTGFSAVGRFALPSPLPAIFRYELQPQPCIIECGACVPLFGQSGGGVEVKIVNQTMNRCAIADPVLLPIM